MDHIASRTQIQRVMPLLYQLANHGKEKAVGRWYLEAQAQVAARSRSASL